jgi:hypothetical protein
MMDVKITAEWLKSFGDDDICEPSAWATGADLAELARRQEMFQQKKKAQSLTISGETEHRRKPVLSGQ